jgi:hypothetical protein
MSPWQHAKSDEEEEAQVICVVQFVYDPCQQATRSQGHMFVCEL